MNPLPIKQSDRCICDLCNGKYIQVDPVKCECTECITGQYRPAISEEDYEAHNNLGTNSYGK